MAQQVLIYRLTGSAVSLGIISFIGLIPLIPLSLWGGSITDRFPKRTIILIAQSLKLPSPKGRGFLEKSPSNNRTTVRGLFQRLYSAPKGGDT